MIVGGVVMRLRHLVLGLGFIVLVVTSARTLAQGPPAAPMAGRFTLRADNVPLSKALAELARQTGVRVEDRRGVGDTRIDVALERVTFWQALDALADAATAVPYFATSKDGISLVKRPEGWQKPPTSYDDRFRVIIKRVVLARDLEAEKGTCSLSLEVAWVPAMLPLFLETKAQKLRVLDERGNAVPLSEEGSSVADADGKLSFPAEVSFPALARSSPRLGLIEGKLSVIAPNKMLTFSFATLDRLSAAPANGPLRRLTEEGAVCQIEKLTLVRDRWTVRVAVVLGPGGKDLGSFQANSWPVNNEMFLVSADGKRRVPSSSYVLESATARRAVLSYHFVDRGGFKRGRPQDWHVVYRSPGKIVEVPFSFRFANVPLP